MDKKTIIVVGAGQGLGNHIAKRFGREGFRVILIARNGQSLRNYQKQFSEEGMMDVYVHEADAANPKSLTEAITWAKQQFGTPDILVYNIGVMTADEPEKIDCVKLMYHYQVDVASAYVCVQQIIGEEFAKKSGTIIFTGGGVAKYPTTQYLPLSLGKSALRTLAYILHDKLKPQGIFVGTITVSGAVGADKFFAPSQIAEAYWEMYQERKNCEFVYEYPELKDATCSGAEYWKKVYELVEKYK